MVGRGVSGQRDELLLLHVVCDVGVEADGEERVVVEYAVGGAQESLAVALYVPGHADARREVVLVARESLLYVERVIEGERVGRGHGET